jgi:two-component system, cell cycle sensor histidine kinase and response regulator CckA
MRWRLGNRILVGLIANLFLAIVCIALLAVFQARRALREKTIDDFGNIAEELYYNATKSVAKGDDDVEAIASSPQLAQPDVGADEKRQILVRLKKIYSVYDDITLVDLEGNVIASTDYNFRGSWRFKEPFIAAAKGAHARSNAHFIPYPLRPIVSFFGPVSDAGGRRSAIVAIQLELGHLSDLIAHLRIGRTGYAMLIDEHGKFLFHPDARKILTHAPPALLERMRRRAEWVELTEANGARFLGNYFGPAEAATPIPKGETRRPIDWKVVVVQEESEVFAPFGALVWQIALSSLLLFGAATIVASRLSRGIIRPVAKLMEGARRVGLGDWEHRVEVKGADEIAELADSFNAMARELSENHGYLKNVLDTLSTMLIAVDRQGVVSQWNAAAEKYTGIPAREALGRDLWEVQPQLEQFLPDFELLLATREPREHLRRLVKLDDRRFLDVSMYPFALSSGEGALIAVSDVTEQERKDEQLLQAQKMELVGNLAGGLSHDINNSLGGIVGLSSLMRFALRRGRVDVGDLLEKTALIEESAKRASETVLKLLAFSRKQELTLTKVDLSDLVRAVLRICATTFDKSIEQRAELPDAPAVIMADPALVEQVILNLCVNAEHAMTIMRPPREPRGGSLAVSVEPFVATRHFVEAHPEAREGHFFAVRVRDTGVGMEPETITRIFEPFFTTKGEGRGTGLGLAMVYSIVQRTGGFLTVYSEPGTGSTFTVFLPAMKARSGGSSASIPPPEEELPMGSGTVLVVDDEETVRLAAAASLEECGYATALAKNGGEAVEIFRERPGDFALVLLDVAMPVLSGERAFAALKEIDPGVRVLITSGFEDDKRVREVLDAGAAGFIHKPYNLYELARAVKAAMASR